ncbi:unnamed protein product [Strongylus vulgaris]|uniref:Uncharacterized protein n=1 Tax=Strongylus vulgaris TaxID=40348 RepID=A0A3P7JLD7_STRVU|nr:unnamed protein product [Strongylus vulgaris]
MVGLLAWPTLSWASGEPEMLNSFLAWETLLEDKPPLYFALRHQSQSHAKLGIRGTGNVKLLLSLGDPAGG